MPPIEIKTNSDGSATCRADPAAVNNTATSVSVTYADGTTESSGDCTDASSNGISASQGHGGIVSITFSLAPPSTLSKTVKFTDSGWTH